MTELIKAFTFAIILTTISVQPLEPLHQENGVIISKIVRLLLNADPARRNINLASLKRARGLYDIIAQDMKDKKKKQLLSAEPAEKEERPGIINKDAIIAEAELKDSLAQKNSALLDRPIVEHKGKDDFLVMRPDIVDPFVTVIPNAMYINIEKKCVNWLDDCSLRGIRARLLKGMQSPYL